MKNLMLIPLLTLTASFANANPFTGTGPAKSTLTRVFVSKDCVGAKVYGTARLTYSTSVDLNRTPKAIDRYTIEYRLFDAHTGEARAEGRMNLAPKASPESGNPASTIAAGRIDGKIRIEASYVDNLFDILDLPMANGETVTDRMLCNFELKEMK